MTKQKHYQIGNYHPFTRKKKNMKNNIEERYNVKNVPRNVKLAISKYCKDKRLTQAKFLSDDKRIKNYL